MFEEYHVTKIPCHTEETGLSGFSLTSVNGDPDTMSGDILFYNIYRPENTTTNTQMHGHKTLTITIKFLCLSGKYS